MKIFNYQAVILSILFANLSTINGSVFSDHTGLSLKTIRKEMDDLNLICNENGCNIISHPGSGYELDVLDRDVFRRFRNQVERQYRNSFFYEDVQDERIHYIIRRLLCRRNLYINDLMDECNCSESSIRRDMAGIKEMLAKYKLTLINRTNKGMSLEGDEWHIRVAFIRENYYYLKMNRVYFLDDDKEFEKLISYDKKTLDELSSTVKDVLREHQYYLSHSCISRFSVLLCVSVIRQRHENELLDTFKGLDLSQEENIIKDILARFRLFNRVEFSAKGLAYLAIMLRGSRLLKFNTEFLLLPDKEEIQAIVDGFLLKLRSIYNLHDADVTALYKDLCGAIYQLKYLGMIDMHEHEKNINEFTRDSLFNLDLASLLYMYLKNERHFNCDKCDVAILYHIFINFNLYRNEAIRRKILVMADKGYFYARSIANLMNSRNSVDIVEYIPRDYMRIYDEEIVTYDGILTDIEELKQRFPDKTFASLNLHRSAKRIANISQYFVLNKSDFARIFSIDDIFYAEKIRNEEDILNYVKEVVLEGYDGAESFILEAKIKAGIFGNFKTNNTYVVSSYNDYLDETLVRLVFLDKTIRIANHNVNKILIFNFKDNDMFTRTSIMNLASRVLHSQNTFINYDRERDYRNFFSLMYGDID